MSRKAETRAETDTMGTVEVPADGVVRAKSITTLRRHEPILEPLIFLHFSYRVDRSDTDRGVFRILL